MDQLIRQLARHEGFRGQPYKDTEGHTTIGYGRNLDARPLTHEEGRMLLERDLLLYSSSLEARWPECLTLDDVRYSAVLNMAYNLGVDGLMKFRQMRAALEARNWDLAAGEALNSLWAQQVGRRAREIAYMLETGRWPDADA